MDSYVKSMKLSIDAAFSDASKKSMHDFVEGLKETKINLISDDDVGNLPVFTVVVNNIS